MRWWDRTVEREPQKLAFGGEIGCNIARHPTLVPSRITMSKDAMPKSVMRIDSLGPVSRLGKQRQVKSSSHHLSTRPGHPVWTRRKWTAKYRA